ncbi:MAG: HAMP domain-containing sensor histidine kinase [Pseudomonadota bacterium]
MITGISARLLLLTILVVMAVEVAIFVPSVAQFRKSFLEERLVRAEIAALTVMAAPGGRAESALQAELLDTADALNIVVQKEGRRILALEGEGFPAPTDSFDLREATSLDLIRDAIVCLVASKDGQVQRIVGTTGEGMYDSVEITIEVAQLRAAMIDYGLRILQLSLIISVITAGVVFFTVRRFVVAPLLDVIRNVEQFHENPEDRSRIMQPKGTAGEVADAERAIAAMQTEVITALGQRRRLAELGGAVAKINHDLRNMLAAGQLMTERLGASEDPLVARVLPKLVGSLDRASALCQSTLDYGRAEEPEPTLRPVAVEQVLADVVESLGLAPEPLALPLPASAETAATRANRTTAPGGGADRDTDPEGLGATEPLVLADGPVRILSEVPRGVTVTADPDFLFRIFANLIRNAVEAIRSSSGRGAITLSLAPEGPEGQMASGTSERALKGVPGTGERAPRGGPGTVRDGANGGHVVGAGAPTAASCHFLLSDTGPGLPEKARDNLFRPFRSSTRRGGTGLGLVIASELAVAQGGQLSLVSTSPAGTVFALCLRPAAAANRLNRSA